MSELPTSLLRSWPGRFRYPDLADTLAREAPSPGDLADAALLGVIGGHDEAAALQHLITSGRFRAARRLLDECPVWDGETRKALAQAIEKQVRTFQQQLGADYYECRRRADAAGVPWNLRLPELEERCVDDWPSVYEELDFARGQLDQEVEDRRDDLEARRKQDLADTPDLAAVCSSLLKSDQLEAALHLLDHGVLDVHPPEAVPAPPDLPAGSEPLEVLRWQLNPSVGPPPRIDAQWLAKGSSGARAAREVQRAEAGPGAGRPRLRGRPRRFPRDPRHAGHVRTGRLRSPGHAAGRTGRAPAPGTPGPLVSGAVRLRTEYGPAAPRPRPRPRPRPPTVRGGGLAAHDRGRGRPHRGCRALARGLAPAGHPAAGPAGGPPREPGPRPRPAVAPGPARCG